MPDAQKSTPKRTRTAATAPVESGGVSEEDAVEPEYSGRLEGFQRAERAATEAGFGMAEAVTAGIEEWRTRSRKSAKKSKDGAIKDSVQNGAHAVGKLLGRLAEVPGNIMEEVDLEINTSNLLKNVPFVSDWSANEDEDEDEDE